MTETPGLDNFARIDRLGFMLSFYQGYACEAVIMDGLARDHVLYVSHGALEEAGKISGLILEQSAKMNEMLNEFSTALQEKGQEDE